MAGKPFKQTEIDIMIGQLICIWRQKMGLSQKDVAAGVGISFQQLQKYEAAANRISVSRLYAIARFMQVPIGRFFDMADTVAAAPDRETRNILQTLLRISDADRRLILNILHRLQQ